MGARFPKDGTSFKGLFKGSANTSFESPSPLGSIVRVAGICSVIADDAEPVVSGPWHPRTFQILLRSPADLVTIEAPSWWTPRHVIFVLLVVTGGSVLITALVMWLARQRLREQAQRRAMAEAEFAAILSERKR